MNSVFFERRELKPWAEYATAEALTEGTVYFRVHYLDQAMLVPSLEPLVFIGRDLELGESGIIYFQDASSYLAGIRPFEGPDATAEDDQQTSNVYVHSMKADECHVLEYEKAIDVLLQCALRRR